jgi:hypothetical protein
VAAARRGRMLECSPGKRDSVHVCVCSVIVADFTVFAACGTMIILVPSLQKKILLYTLIVIYSNYI